MKKIIYVIAMLAFIITTNISNAAVKIGSPAPTIKATDIFGNDFDLESHKGKIVVLEWTNHQCPFVIKHYDSGNMQKLQKQATAIGNVEWISINSSADGKQGNITAEKAQTIIKDQGASPTTQILDPSGEIGKTYGAKTTPHMFVIDTKGNIAYAGAIDDNSSPRQSTIKDATNYVMAAIQSLKAGTAIEVTATQPYGCAVKY